MKLQIKGPSVMSKITDDTTWTSAPVGLVPKCRTLGS